MFGVIQFPLTDCRPFLDIETGRLADPVWPIVNLPDEPYKAPFVRGFGSVRRRQRGGVVEWASEDAFCDVSHALRFQRATLADTDVESLQRVRRYCAFRRLYWDGKLWNDGSVVGRVEVGFGIRGVERVGGFDGAILGKLIDGLFRQEVRIRSMTAADASSATGTKSIRLSNAGSALAKACLRSSTRFDAQHLLEDNEWWLQAASPLLILEYVRGVEVTASPPHTIPVALERKELAGINVFLGRRRLDGRERAVWFFECDAQVNRDALRRLRINLTRLHAAFSSLRVISDLRGRKKIAPKSDAVHKRLDQTLSSYLPFLYTNRQNGVSWTEFLRAAMTLRDACTPNDLATLRELMPEPARGLRSQLELAADSIVQLAPSEFPPIQWDIFISHAGVDTQLAEQLFQLLGDRARVYLDSKDLRYGDDWDTTLPAAQRASLMTVVLVTRATATDRSHYQRSEIALAISLARQDAQRHRVVPIYVDVDPKVYQPYGLNLKHHIVLDGAADLARAATKLVETLAETGRAAATTQQATDSM